MTSDQRQFARIETALSCMVATESTSFEAELINLSLSGAALLGPPGAAAHGESLTIMLEQDTGLMSIALPGVVVRVAEHDAENTLYGVHFEALPPDVRGELVMLLRLIAAGRGAGRRDAPRISARVGVTFGSEKRFRAVMSELSRGGFSVRCSRALKEGEIVRAKFGVTGLPDLIEVQGPVINSQPLPDGHFRLGVKFDPLPEGTEKRLHHLIDLLLGLAPRQGIIVEEDDDDAPAPPEAETDE